MTLNTKDSKAKLQHNWEKYSDEELFALDIGKGETVSSVISQI